MRYRRIIIFFFSIMLSFPLMAQLGKTEKKLTSRHKKRNIVQKMRARPGFHEVMFKLDRDFLLVARIREEDSRAVMLSYSQQKPAIDSTFYEKTVSESFKDFSPQLLYTSQDDYERRTCLYNKDKGELVMRIHGPENEEFPLKGFMLINDPELIQEILGSVQSLWVEKEL